MLKCTQQSCGGLHLQGGRNLRMQLQVATALSAHSPPTPIPSCIWAGQGTTEELSLYHLIKPSHSAGTGMHSETENMA